MKRKRLLTPSSPSGALFRACIDSSEQPIWIASALCYQMYEPTHEHYDMCRERLDEQMAGVKVVFTVDKWITDYLLGEKSFGTKQGTANWYEPWQCWIIPTYNTSLALATSNDEVVIDILRDFAKAPIYRDLKPSDNPIKIEYVYSGDHARDVFNSLSDEAIYALDVETLQELDKIVCLAISDGTTSWVFTQDALDGLDPGDWPMDVKWCFHNGIFDTRMMFKMFGIWLPIVEDTLLQSHSLDNRSGGEAEDTTFVHGVHGLKRLAAEYEAAGIYNISVRTAIEKEQWPTLWEYNAKDAAYTARLCARFTKMQIADGVRDSYLKLSVPLANVLNQQQESGVPIDRATLGKLALMWGQEYLDLEDELERIAWDSGWDGKEPLNPRSPKQLVRFLYDVCKLKPTKFGRVTHVKALNELKHPYIEVLLKSRYVNKMLGTYVVNIERNLDPNGRVHPNVNMHGTRTHRLSYNEPPVQTVPSDYGRTGGEHFGMLRDLISVIDDGMVCFAADYEQAELWSMFMLSGDEEMLKDLMTGDFHSAASESMFKTTRDQHTKGAWQQIRFQSKFVTFGVAFGRSEYSLAENQLKGYTVKECREFIDRWYGRYWQFKNFVDEQHRIIQEVGEQVTPSGRKFRYPVILNSDAYRKCINHPVQSLSHDHLIASNIDLHPIVEKMGGHIWFDVHDAFLGEIPDRNKKEFGEILVEVMQTPRFHEIGIPVELKIGTNWRNAKVVFSGKDGWTWDKKQDVVTQPSASTETAKLGSASIVEQAIKASSKK